MTAQGRVLPIANRQTQPSAGVQTAISFPCRQKNGPGRTVGPYKGWLSPRANWAPKCLVDRATLTIHVDVRSERAAPAITSRAVRT
ncbi:hypothetical protein B0G77_8697 [Paraburkholderia sp. BL10I2N1]|nr:hypothetical protein B0G77_8697 [Paraburkholderia sp. BL10I2N1]